MPGKLLFVVLMISDFSYILIISLYMTWNCKNWIFFESREGMNPKEEKSK